MEAVFLQMLNMSFTGGVVILAVLIGRLLLRKTRDLVFLRPVERGIVPADLPRCFILAGQPASGQLQTGIF